MKFIPSKILIGIAVSTFALSNTVLAEETATEVQADEVKQQAQEQVQNTFVPIVVGAPIVRVGGGSRGDCGDLGEGITLNAQPLTWSKTPNLSWSISKPVSGTFVFKVGESPNKNWDYVKPLIDETLELSVSEGDQTLSLAKYKLDLKEGVDYEWFLSLICDSENRSKDIIVGGTVQR